MAPRSVIIQIPVAVHDFGLEKGRIIVPQLGSLAIQRRSTRAG